MATDDRVSREAVRGRIKELNESINKIGRQGEFTTGKLIALAEEREVLVKEIDAVKVLVEEFTSITGDDPDAARKEVTARCGLLEKQIQEAAGEVTQAARELETVMLEREAAKKSIRELQVEVRELSEKLEGASKGLARLSESSRNKGAVGLDSSDEIVRERKRLTEVEERSAQKLLQEEKEAIRTDEESVTVGEAALASSEEEESSLVRKIAKLGDGCREIEGMLTDAKVEPGEDHDAVLKHANEVVEKASTIERLIEDVAELELVIDAVTTRAAYRRLQSRLAKRRTAKMALVSKRDVYVQWQKYFGKILELVAFEQDKAVSKFTRDYGPRTSVIQRRLRSVYGFDDVDIRSEGSKILVRVSRNSKLLRPTDYFSQSQQQTLLLGLFFAASVSQTWSGLAPVFLDDPIAHFDDLNVFAFLDLIDGLLSDHGAGKRQFVLSTCDEKFLELAREKFAYRGGNVKYYSFNGIGENGPIVEVA